MTEVNFAAAIAACDEIKARLEAMQDMLKPKPPLSIESITCSNHAWELHCAGDLICPEGTVIEASDGWRYYRLAPHQAADWKSDTGGTYTHSALWNSLIQDVADGITFEYAGSF